MQERGKAPFWGIGIPLPIIILLFLFGVLN